jgi:hypothetical protein
LTPELVVVGRIRRSGAARPRPGAVVVSRGQIVAIGEARDILGRRGRATVVVGSPGAAVLPGFVDAHLHFLALARRLGEVDCSPEHCPSVEAILARLRAASARLPRGAWVRAFGYDEAFLPGGRGPNLAELDAAVPDRPVRLLHRTGHAARFNRAALSLLELPPEALERDPRGEPTGVVFEPQRFTAGRLPEPSEDELSGFALQVSTDLLAAGVTTFHDPTPGQGATEVSRFARLLARGAIRQRVRLFVAPGRLEEAREAARVELGDLRVCGTKVVLAEREPDEEALALAFREAARLDGQVAVHAVEGGSLAVVAEALASLGAAEVSRRRHRVEHASLCPPPLADALAEVGATIVTHPDFLARFAGKYIAEIPSELHEWLYPLRAFLDRRLSVGFGSDAPIAPPLPLAAVAAAVRRVSPQASRPLGPLQAVSVCEALDLATTGAAAAARDEGSLGTLDPGAAADLVVLEADPEDVEPSQIAAIPVRATVVDGRLAWPA